MPPDRQNSEAGDEDAQSKALRVLIVDDDRDTLLTLGLLCREEGMYVHLLRDGKEVAQAVASFRPHVLLLDIALPDRTGFDIAEEVTARYREERPVLIAVTAYSSEADRRLAKAAGFDDFIAKPYDPQTVLRRLAAVKRK